MLNETTLCIPGTLANGEDADACTCNRMQNEHKELSISSGLVAKMDNLLSALVA